MYMNFLLKSEPGKPFLPCQWPHWLVDEAKKLRWGRLGKVSNAFRRAVAIVNFRRLAGGNLLQLVDSCAVIAGLNGDGRQNMVREIVKDIMAKVSFLPAAGLGDLIFRTGDNGMDLEVPATLAAILIESSPHPGLDGRASVIDVNLQHDRCRIITRAQGAAAAQTGPGLMSIYLDVSQNSSRALLAARNATDGSGNTKVNVDLHPNKGFDQPRLHNMSYGNPDWKKIEDRYKLDSKPSAHYDGEGKEKGEEEEEEVGRDDWSDIGDALSVISFDSVTGGNPDAAQVVLFQEIPPEVRHLAADVYITCQDEKNPKVPVKVPQGSRAYTLRPENPSSGFFNTLHLQALSLSAVPDTVHNTPIHADDEVFKWLSLFCSWEAPKDKDKDALLLPGFALELLKVSEWPDTNLITNQLEFGLTLPYLDKIHLRFSTDVGAKSTFSSVYGADSAIGDGKDQAVTEEGLRAMHLNRRTLVFGLQDLDTPLQTTLGDLCKFIRLDILSHPLLQFLAGSLPLSLNTKEDFHNAIWFRPGKDYETNMRLQFHAKTDKFNDWLHELSPSLNVDMFRVVARKKGSWMWVIPKDQMDFSSSLTFICRMSISTKLQLEGVVKMAENSVSLSLTLMASKTGPSLQAMQGDESVLDSVIEWLVEHFQLSLSSRADLKDLLAKGSKSEDSKTETGVISKSSIIPRRIHIELGLDAKGKITGTKSIRVDIEACLVIGRTTAAVEKKTPIVFLFTFGWQKGSGIYFRGRLWTVIPPTPFSAYDRALPEYEEHDVLKPMSPVDPKNQLRTIDLGRLLSDTDKESEISRFPAGIPNEIYLCEISLSQGNVSFKGMLRCSEPGPTPGKPGEAKPPPPVPPAISLEMVHLAASYTWGTTNPKANGFKFELAIAVDLLLGGKLNTEEGDDEQYDKAAKLTGLVKYDRGDWTIQAAVQDLSIQHLLQFWDLDDRGPISDFLGKINIDFIGIKYEYKNGKTATGAMIDDGRDPRSPSLLEITGQFTFDNVATLSFTYTNKGGQDWVLEGGLAPSEKTSDTATIGGLLSGLMDTAIIEALPDAIQHAKIGGGKDEEGKRPLQMLIAKSGGVSIFAFLVQIEAVSVWFIQLRDGPKGAVKRIIKAGISKVSVDVSAFQTTINSPWEDLFFMWVQDQTVPKEGVDALTGITQKEFDAMSEVMKEKLKVPDEQLMLFKPAEKKEPEDKAETALQLRRRVAEGGEKGAEGGDDKEAKKVVVAAGSHIVIVAKKPGADTGVILDCVFGQKKKKSTTKTTSQPGHALVHYAEGPGKGPEKDPKKDPKSQPDASGSEKGVKAAYKIKIGPLSVGNIGLWFKNGMIGITLDATLIMGPIGLSLLGFTIGVPFSKKYNLQNPPPLGDVEWGLQGLILALDKPPLTIAGGFMRDTSNADVEVMYTGGLVVGFKPWSFEAMGAYATVYKTKAKTGEWTTRIDTKPLSQFTLLSLGDDSEETPGREILNREEKRETFTFSFIFVKMNGPLFSVGFADFAGLVGGFGINSDISLPTVEQVTQFPFIAERNSDDESSPVERMQQLMQGSWFRPAEGLYWAAAGARVTAFQMLAANIVLVLQFGNGNLLFGIFGVATCDVPALEAPVKFAHIELGIVCTFDVKSGIFKFEAQLSPRSFVLAPQCHLTGGMALFAWSKGDTTDSDKKNHISAGDWVLTIGGYHRAFHPPKQYPKPPRLGISWSLSSCLSVKGEAYFAITPKVCMGGGRVRAALSIGVLYAWFDAFMDFLMNFEPFFFQMAARVSVGVRFTLDLWLVTIRINIEISAGLDLNGPPFGGVVHVDFWVFGFDIKFGDSTKSPPAIGLDRFFDVATKAGKSSGASSSRGFLAGGGDAGPPAKPQADTAAILLTCETGLLPPLQNDDTKTKPQDALGTVLEGDKWYVKGANFSLLASFQVPVTSAKLVETRTQKTKEGEEVKEYRCAVCDVEDKYKEVYAKPMQLYSPLDSAVRISIKAPEPRMASTQQVHILEEWKDQKWKLTAQVQPVQSSIWGKYNKNEDPALVKGPIEGLLDGKGATMQLITGISILPPDPAMAGDLINTFNVTEDHKASVFNPYGPRWPLFIGVTTDQKPAWAPKQRSQCWKDVTKAWNKVGDATTTKVVELWAKRMRYDAASIEGEQREYTPKETFKPLRGVAPRKLLNNYSQLVPALPFVAVGQAVA
ncbi:hypothetical protein CC79DRAFT_153986 [Sarocladium strictum]